MIPIKKVCCVEGMTGNYILQAAVEGRELQTIKPLVEFSPSTRLFTLASVCCFPNDSILKCQPQFFHLHMKCISPDSVHSLWKSMYVCCRVRACVCVCKGQLGSFLFPRGQPLAGKEREKHLRQPVMVPFNSLEMSMQTENSVELREQHARRMRCSDSD